MTSDRDKKLSRYLSKVLRHQPERISIQLTSNGWADIDELLAGCWANHVAIERDDLVRIAESPANQRYELDLSGNRVRARYGHSIALDRTGVAAAPPARLYHGTASFNLDSILREGIVPMGRRMVHLSTTSRDAERVGRRHGAPVVLTIDAARAADAGAEFYVMSQSVWQADWVAPEFIAAPAKSIPPFDNQSQGK